MTTAGGGLCGCCFVHHGIDVGGGDLLVEVFPIFHPILRYLHRIPRKPRQTQPILLSNLPYKPPNRIPLLQKRYIYILKWIHLHLRVRRGVADGSP